MRLDESYQLLDDMIAEAKASKTTSNDLMRILFTCLICLEELSPTLSDEQYKLIGETIELCNKKEPALYTLSVE